MREASRVERLEPPGGRVRVVVDTDAANEIDDQFALAYALLSSDRLAVEAVYAAPFAGRGTTDGSEPLVGPAEGMQRSHEEIRRVLRALGATDLLGSVHSGSEGWLPDPTTPVPSAAVDDLVARAAAGPATGGPLYVVALGAPTNIASALLVAPNLAERIVVVWLGGNGTWWTPAAMYNLEQDPHASRVLLDCGVPLVHVPCRQVTEKLLTTPGEIERRVRGRGEIGNYLAELYRSFDHDSERTKELWDLGPIAWLTHPAWCPSALVHSPVLHDDLTWGHDVSRHFIREVRDLDADAILLDFFSRLPAAVQPQGGTGH